MGSTTPYSLRYPEYGQGADVKLDLQKLAEDIAPRLHRAEPLTTAQITAISTPRIGQLVFNTDLGRSQEWNGSVWRAIGGGASGATSVGSVSFTVNTWKSMPYFVGLGFGEVEFVLGQPDLGSGVLVTAVSLPEQAVGLVSSNNAAASGGVFIPASATTASIGFTWSTNASGSMYMSLRNVVYSPATGYLTFELMSASTATSISTIRMNWRAR